MHDDKKRSGSQQTDIWPVIARIVDEISRDYSVGELACMRRLLGVHEPGALLWKLLARYQLEVNRSQEETKWALLFASVACLHGLNDQSTSLGSALAASKFSEMRLLKLLDAREMTFYRILGMVVRFLAAKGERVNFMEVARLIFCDGQKTRAVRLKIAKDYYRINDQ